MLSRPLTPPEEPPLPDLSAVADKIACAEVIQNWGVFRDQGRWKELRATFTPDGHISVFWFRPQLVPPSPVRVHGYGERRSRHGGDAGRDSGTAAVRRHRGRSGIMLAL